VVANLVGVLLAGAFWLLLTPIMGLAEQVSNLAQIGAKLAPWSKTAQDVRDSAVAAADGVAKLRKQMGEQVGINFQGMVSNIAGLQTGDAREAARNAAIGGWEQRQMAWANNLNSEGVVVPPRPDRAGMPITINIGGNVYGVENLEEVIQSAIAGSMGDAARAY